MDVYTLTLPDVHHIAAYASIVRYETIQGRDGNENYMNALDYGTWRYALRAIGKDDGSANIH